MSSRNYLACVCVCMYSDKNEREGSGRRKRKYIYTRARATALTRRLMRFLRQSPSNFMPRYHALIPPSLASVSDLCVSWRTRKSLPPFLCACGKVFSSSPSASSFHYRVLANSVRRHARTRSSRVFVQLRLFARRVSRKKSDFCAVCCLSCAT